MSFKEIYEFAQSQPIHVKRNVIRAKVAEITGREIFVIKTALDVSSCRGLYFSSNNFDHPYKAMHGKTLVVLARDLNRCWERLVQTKETMHAFDNANEATDNADVFENLLIEFGLDVKNKSPQMASETNCFWMSLAVLCPERYRQEFIQLREKGHIDDYGIALKLRIPQFHVRFLLSNDFQNVINELCGVSI